MENEHQHHLIACRNVSQKYDYDFSLPKRKRRNSFRIMEQVLEIEETYRPIRGTHDIIANEPRRAIEKDLNQQAEIISSVMERAERVQEKHKIQFPSFVKSIDGDPSMHNHARKIDHLIMQEGQIIRARAKKFKEALMIIIC